ncbi:hypothetical protein [Pseudomonas kuykendallii]|uniref:hypothetical protein n=1 Tax=Pseudomonas kuykendallii TaxID=1007099 RepID=UPI0028D77047|nr:hypothetical protein [Pseudomonas kuykendallii]
MKNSMLLSLGLATTLACIGSVQARESGALPILYAQVAASDPGSVGSGAMGTGKDGEPQAESPRSGASSGTPSVPASGSEMNGETTSNDGAGGPVADGEPKDPKTSYDPPVKPKDK